MGWALDEGKLEGAELHRTFGSLFFPSAKWVSRIKLRLGGKSPPLLSHLDGSFFTFFETVSHFVAKATVELIL